MFQLFTKRKQLCLSSWDSLSHQQTHLRLCKISCWIRQILYLKAVISQPLSYNIYYILRSALGVAAFKAPLAAKTRYPETPETVCAESAFLFWCAQNCSRDVIANWGNLLSSAKKKAEQGGWNLCGTPLFCSDISNHTWNPGGYGHEVLCCFRQLQQESLWLNLHAQCGNLFAILSST